MIFPERGGCFRLSSPENNQAPSMRCLISESPQLPVTTKQRPRATGDLWQPSAANPTTVPVPLPVVVVRVDGPFTALDRKLWLALVHIAFPDLDKPGHIHEISIGEIIELFRKVSGRRDLGAKGTLQLTKKLSENTEAAVLWQSIVASRKRRSNGKTTTIWALTRCLAHVWTKKRAFPANCISPSIRCWRSTFLRRAPGRDSTSMW